MNFVKNDVGTKFWLEVTHSALSSPCQCLSYFCWMMMKMHSEYAQRHSYFVIRFHAGTASGMGSLDCSIAETQVNGDWSSHWMADIVCLKYFFYVLFMKHIYPTFFQLYNKALEAAHNSSKATINKTANNPKNRVHRNKHRDRPAAITAASTRSRAQ